MDRAFKSLIIFIHRKLSFCLFLLMVPQCNYPQDHLHGPLSLGVSCENIWKWLLFPCHARTWEPTRQSLVLYVQVHCAAILIFSIFFYFAACFPFGLIILESLLGRPIGPYQEDQPISVFSLLPIGSPFSPCPGRFQLLREEFNSQALRTTIVSLSTYSRIHLLKWKEGAWSSRCLLLVWPQSFYEAMNEGLDGWIGQRGKDGWQK